MRTFIMVALSLVALTCLAERPQPCSSPPLLTGALTVSTQNEKLWTYARFLYDALGQRIRIREKGNYDNKTFAFDALLLYKEHVMFLIDGPKRQCTKKKLATDFQPFAVPKDASLLGQSVLGSSSGRGMGVLVNTWWGSLPNNTGKYMATVTEFGCIPVSTAYQTAKYGWVLVSLFNNVIGIADPQELNPPAFCQHADESAAEHGNQPPADFFSLFLKSN